MFNQLLANYPLMAALAGLIIAQLLKYPTALIMKKDCTWHIISSPGGMPSSHSAAVVALSTSLGIRYGFDQPSFAIAFVFSIIVMYDAMGVRRETGRQAKAINLIMKELFESGVNDFLNKVPIKPQEQWNKLKEVVGHEPFEVMGGFILGLIVAIAMNQWFY